MTERLSERLAAPHFSPAGDARATYETSGTSFLQYLARRAAKSRILLPLGTLLRSDRAGGPEFAGALVCFAYFCVAASTTYGSGYQQPNFTDEQIVRILQEADKDPVAEVAKRHGVSEPSIYAWRKKFGDMGTDDVKRLKQLEQENNRLKKILAERDLEIEVMKEIAVKKW